MASNSKRRPSLAALARSRGYEGANVGRNSDTLICAMYDAWAWGNGTIGNMRACETFAPTREAAEAGLRAALEALPPVRAKGKR